MKPSSPQPYKYRLKPGRWLGTIPAASDGSGKDWLKLPKKNLQIDGSGEPDRAGQRGRPVSRLNIIVCPSTSRVTACHRGPPAAGVSEPKQFSPAVTRRQCSATSKDSPANGTSTATLELMSGSPTSPNQTTPRSER